MSAATGSGQGRAAARDDRPSASASVQALAARIRSALPRDARVYQILFLGALLSIGVLVRDFSLRPEQMAATFLAGIAMQIVCIRALRLRDVGVLSAVITCFGLSLLLRADNAWVHPLAACIAIGSKFVVRVAGKHVYNPANLGVVAAVLLLPGAWISAGQWGSDVLLAGWFVALGGIVTARARRYDVSLAFLGCYAALLAARVAWLGQDAAILVHQLSGGALLLFTFFMISDPMTTPDRRVPRIAFAVCVAAGAYLWQFVLFKPNALVFALFLATPLVPILDRLFPGERPAWRAPSPALERDRS